MNSEEKKARVTWAQRMAQLQLIIQNVTLEPVVALNACANMMQSTVLQSLAMTKFCLNEYEQTEYNCTNVTDRTLKENLTGSVAYYQFYRQCLELGPCILVALFLGSWSDKYGRKLLILIPLSGDTISCAIYTLQSYFLNARVYYLLFGSTVQGLTGGDLIFNMAIQSFVIELSSQRTRTLRIAMVEVGFLIGAPIGALLGGIIHAKYGYIYVFLTSFLINCSALIYALIRLRKIPLIKKIDKSSPFLDIFRTDNLTGSINVIFKKRDGRKRLYILLTAIGLWLLLFPRYGNLSIHFLYMHLKFNYTVAQYSVFLTIFLIAVALGDLVFVPILSYLLKLKDATLGTIATVMCIIGEMVVAFSINSLMLYLAIIPLTFLGASGIAGRALLSKCVDNSELGRMLSFLGCIFAFSPIVSGLLYAKLFNATLTSFLGSCFLVSAGINLTTVVIYGWIRFDMVKTSKKEKLKMEKSDKKIETSYDNQGFHKENDVETTVM